MKDYNGVIKANTYVKIRDEDHLEVVKGEMRKVYSDVDTNQHCFTVGFFIVFWSNSRQSWGNFRSMSHAHTPNNVDYTEIFIEAPATKPTPPFKVRNGNDPAVRQWLVDNGWDFFCGGKSLATVNKNTEYLFVYANNLIDYGRYESTFNSDVSPELSLNISNITREVVTTITEPQVTSWNMVDPEKSERMERITKIEAELAELKKLG